MNQGKRPTTKNEQFRQRPFRGAKLEDAIFHVRKKINRLLDSPDLNHEQQAELKLLERLEQYMVIKFDYEDLEE